MFQRRYFNYIIKLRPHEYVASLMNLLPSAEYSEPQRDYLRTLCKMRSIEKQAQSLKLFLHNQGYAPRFQNICNDGIMLAAFLYEAHEDLSKQAKNNIKNANDLESRLSTRFVCMCLNTIIPKFFQSLAEVDKAKQTLTKIDVLPQDTKANRHLKSGL